MNTLNLRSKIVVRYTTAPSDLGYGGQPTGWRSSRGEIMGIRRAVRFAGELSQQIGQGTYRLIEYSHHGQVIDVGTLYDAVTNAEYLAMNAASKR